MRVVIALHSLAGTGGTETYALTLARQLQRLSHEVVLSADHLGAMADEAERSGLDVARGPDALPEQCDALLVHDAIVVGRLLERYPRARVVHFAHSDRFDHQLPLTLPGVVSLVVTLSDLVEQRVRALPLDAPVVRLRQPIDTERFADAGPIRPRPRRALILSNYLRGTRRDALVRAWEAQGVEFHSAGGEEGEALDPVPLIGEADVVIGKARAALEGMSCARAVYVYDEYGGDGWVTKESYEAMEAQNFAGFATSARGPRDFAADLREYSPDMGLVNRELVRTHHTARHHAAEVVEAIRSVGEPPAERSSVPSELSRLLRVVWDAERRTLAQGYETQALRQRLHHAEEARAAAERLTAELSGLLSSRRGQLGLRLGRAVDRARGRH